MVLIRVRESKIGVLLLLLALTASVEPLVCPVLGLVHEHRAHSGQAIAGLGHCHGDHDHAHDHGGMGQDHDSHRQGDCDHCHEHQHRVIERPGRSLERPTISPLVIASPANSYDLLVTQPEIASRRIDTTTPLRRPGASAPLPLRI